MFNGTGFDASMTLSATDKNRAVAEARRNRRAAVDAGKVLFFFIAAEFQAFSMTGVKSLSSPIWVTPSKETTSVVKTRSM